MRFSREILIVKEFCLYCIKEDLCPNTEDFMKYLVARITVLLSSTLLFSEQLPKKISKGVSEL